MKISDFGFSTLNIGDADGDGSARAELLHTTCGTPNYVAPEVLGKDGYDGKKADVWSIGVILYVLLAGYLPFDENTMAALFQKIKNAEYEFPDWFSPEGTYISLYFIKSFLGNLINCITFIARDLISKILVPDPHKRPRISELKNHPWMMKGDSGPTPMAPTNHAAANGAPANVQPINNGNNSAAPAAATAPAPQPQPTPAPQPAPVETPAPAAQAAAVTVPTTTSSPATTQQKEEPAPKPAASPAPATTQQPAKANETKPATAATPAAKPAAAQKPAPKKESGGGFFCCFSANAAVPPEENKPSNKV